MRTLYANTYSILVMIDNSGVLMSSVNNGKGSADYGCMVSGEWCLQSHTVFTHCISTDLILMRI